MAEKLGEAVLELRTDDTDLVAGIEQAQRRAEALGDKFVDVGRKISGVGKNLSVAVTAPLAAFGYTAVQAAEESAEAIGQVDAALASMGDRAGRTREQLQALAGNQMAHSLNDDDEILRKVTANLLTFGNVAGTAFDRGQQAAIDMAARMGTDLQSAAMLVGRALNDPIAGLTALTRTGVQFTEQQKEQIKAMVEAGNVAGAQGVILAELERQFAGSAQAMRDADGMAAAKMDFAEFQETIGEKLLPILPVLSDAIVTVLDAFTSLPEGVQTGIVAFLGIAAAVGPVLLGIGGLVTGIGTLLPLFQGVISLIGVLGPALLGLLANPIVLAAAAVIAGIYLAWQNWDKIKPIIDAVAAAVSGWWNDNVKPVLDAVIPVLMAVANFFRDYFGAQIEGVVNVISALMRGDFAGAWEAAKAAVGNMVTAALNLLNALAPGAIAAVRNLYLGVKEWVQDRLGAVFDWLKEKLEAVGAWFHDLYISVVGNSDVPDMIDGVISHFGRLQEGMVKPAEDATMQVAQSFADMAERAIGSIGSITDKIKKGDFLGALQEGIGLLGQFGQVLSGAGASGTGGWLSQAASFLGSIFGGGGGTGGFAGLFGFGGLIPNGSFGIVGDRGPEPVIGTNRGAMVLPNSAMRDGAFGAAPVSINFYGPVSNAAEVRRSAAQAGAALSRMVGEGQRGI